MNKIKQFKKFICLLLGTIMILSLVACQPKATDSSESIMFKAGTYMATAKGHNGDITVEVTVDESSIKDIKILEHIESSGISDPAINRIPNAIVDGQTLAALSVKKKIQKFLVEHLMQLTQRDNLNKELKIL